MKTSKLKLKVSFKFFKFWVCLNAIPRLLGFNLDFYIPARAVKMEIMPDE